MEFSKEQNRAIKEGVDAFFGEAPMDLYVNPVESADDLINRGLVDETGTATPRGVLFTQLQDAGMFDERGAITEKAQVYAMPYEATLQPESIEAYKIRKQDGVDDGESQDFGEIAGGIGEWAWDAGAGLGKRLGYEAQSIWNWGIGSENSKELDAKLDASGAALIEGVVKHNKQLAAMAEVGAGFVGRGLGEMIDMDKEAESIQWQTRQNLDRVNYQNQNIAKGKVLEDVIGIANGVEIVKNAKESLPKEQFDAIMKQGDATAQIVDPFLVVGAGAGKAAGASSMVTRAALKAEKTLAKGLALESGIAGHAAELAIAQRAETMATNAAGLAKKMADDFTERFQATGNEALGQRAAAAADIAAKNEAKAIELTAKANSLSQSIEAMTATRAKLAAGLPEWMATRTQQALEVGKSIKQAPFNVFAKAAEPIGNGLIAVDEGLQSIVKKFGFDKAANVVRGGVGLAGYSFGGLPGLATAGAMVSAGPMLRSAASMARVMGKEIAQARGQIPFWQRVANHSELGVANRAVAHLMDTATLGGIVPGAVRRVGKGAVAPFPTFAMFEFLNEGGDFNADAFKRAAASSLVVGGSMAALGGMFAGTKARHRELALGDERNFRDAIEDPVQKQRFNELPNGMRRSVATYAAANPHLEFRFTTEGQSFHEGNTVSINLKSNNPLKPLIAHEVLHHVVARNQMDAGVSALLIGDGEAGGILRSADGTLDKGFEGFMAEYNQRLKAAGKPPLSVQDAALEYYVDSMADHVAGIAESGELGAIAGRTDARRLIDSVVRATMSRLPIIRDLHFKLGGLMEADGKMVMGSGLLADGIRETPQARRMMREMLKSSAGRAQGQFEAMGQSKAADGGVVLPVAKGDKAILDKLISLFETEEVNGVTRVKYDKNGDPVPISSATDMQRANIGTVAKEALGNLKASGKTFKDGELNVTADGTWEGVFLGDDVIRAIESRNILNKEQIRILKNLNNGAKTNSGSRFSVINHPATKKVGKKVRYATLAPTLRDVVPVAIIPTKDGNLTVGLMSVTQLHNNIETRLQSARGKKLYQGNREAILKDVSEVMELHRQDKSTTPYFNEKYGATAGKEYKNFINTLFGLMSEKMRDTNPLFEADKIGYKDNVYKTYRVDRISQATKMTGDTALPMLFHYERVKMNLMPNGLPTLDAEGNPVVKRFMPEKSNIGDKTHPDNPIVTPEIDAEYLAAVESGDFQKAQTIIDEVALISARQLMEKGDFYDYGIRSTDTEYAVGETTKDISRYWDEGKPTDDVYEGLSTLGVDPSSDAALMRTIRRSREYNGRFAYLMGSDQTTIGGIDPGEVVLVSPMVLMKWLPNARKKDPSGNVIPLSKRFNNQQ